jgi:hypothetical protein
LLFFSTKNDLLFLPLDVLIWQKTIGGEEIRLMWGKDLLRVFSKKSINDVEDT